MTLRAGTSWSQVIDGVQCRVNVVRERGKLALMVTAGIGSGLDYDKFRITCPRAPSRTHSFAHRGYRIAAFCLGKCMLPCANCQNFLHGSRLLALAAVRYSPRGARRKKLRQNAQNWDFTVSHESATLIESRTQRTGCGGKFRRHAKAPLARRAAGAGGDHHETKAAVTRAHLSLRPTARVAV